MVDQREAWLDEPITTRQFLIEQTIAAAEVSWHQAAEATSQVLTAHPEIDPDAIKPRREWGKDKEGRNAATSND